MITVQKHERKIKKDVERGRGREYDRVTRARHKLRHRWRAACGLCLNTSRRKQEGEAEPTGAG